jgi:SWI/SNF-related matrix-associated actin-dependent regulator 1 of chromatin subfamily A
MKTNSYPGKCQSCSSPVGPNKGYVYKNGYRWLTVCASKACIRRLGLTEPEPVDNTRKLTEDGKVIMPFDREALPLLRAMPGARWNPENKCWTVSLAPGDLPRVVELAKELKLEIPDSILSKRAEGTSASRDAKERASRDGLYEFQRVGVEFLALHDHALLADDMGLGKSLQALVALPQNARAIIICPASLKYNWEEEIGKWRNEFGVEVLSGRGSFRLPKENEIVITNYDILPDWLIPKSTGEVSSFNGKPIKKAVVDDDTKKDFAETYLIVDEAHLVKNYKAKRSQKVTELSNLCCSTWFLTGTPLLNRPFDLFGVLSAGGMSKSVFGSWNKFLTLFNGYPNPFGGYSFGLPEPEVSERIRRVMLRRMKSEVLKDLPSKRYQTIVVSNTDTKLQDELDEYWGQYEEQDDLPPFEEFSRLRAALAKSRIPAMLEIVESYEESDEPLLVFSAHKAPIFELAKREGWAIITGDTPPQERHRIKTDFQAGKLKGIGLTVQAGGVGLTLTRASHAVFVDLDWTPALNIQAEDRMVRIGATADHVLIKHLVTDHPLDRHVHHLIQRKMTLIQRTMDKQINFTPPASSSKENPELVDETDEQLKARLEALEAAANKVEEDAARDRIHAILGREQAKSDIPEPELTESRKKLIREALDYMVGRCDGARMKDGIGFNKPDAAIAHWIYRTGLYDNDDTTFRVTERILSRYHTQLGNSFGGIWKPELR